MIQNNLGDYIPKNLKQINHLKWLGQYGNLNQQIGEWKALWDNKPILAGGRYNDNGHKEGPWNELFCNYSEIDQLIESGIYQEGLRVGKWVTSKLLYICQTQYGKMPIGEGMYDDQGRKVGKWVDLHPQFSKDFLLVFEGDYVENVKNGYWSTKFKYFSENKYTIIGGGTYENGVKHGHWIDLSDYFDNRVQYLEEGNYDKGVKKGYWTIQQKRVPGYFLSNILQFPKMFYDKNGKKQGVWIEISKFTRTFGNSFLYSKGWYLDDVKDGYWEIIFMIDGVNFKRGGGKYQNGKKVGKWKEFEQQNDLFWRVQIGDYKEGNKYGFWESRKIKRYLPNEPYRLENTLKNQYSIRVFGMFNENGLEEGHWCYVNEQKAYEDYSQLGIEFKNGIIDKKYEKDIKEFLDII
ncbi:unnamed protein product [Paramecium pentaurelia]|uniref:MORN repeat protein n=1 Tax=Paramecium pentaurelia TaxID=43138 RepID=A0A8S1XQT0_9CILI|nr:unnamed protein product [Paramecium pentaurelia]